MGRGMGGVVLALLVGTTATVRAEVPDAAAGLVGQQATVCSLQGQPYTVTVEQAEAQPTGGAWRLVLVVSAANRGAAPTGLMGGTQLVDQRGRTFSEGGDWTALERVDLARSYGVPVATTRVQPGLTGRTVLPYTVPADVEALTLDQNPTFNHRAQPCPPPA